MSKSSNAWGLPGDGDVEVSDWQMCLLNAENK